MIGLLVKYLAFSGGATAGTQVARGVVRGAKRLVRGDARGALAEVAGGLGSPLVAAMNQLSQLGSEVCRSASALTAGTKPKSDAPAAATTPPAPRMPRRRRRAMGVSAVNGAA
jgi:hypothetical protein